MAYGDGGVTHLVSPVLQFAIPIAILVFSLLLLLFLCFCLNPCKQSPTPDVELVDLRGSNVSRKQNLPRNEERFDWESQGLGQGLGVQDRRITKPQIRNGKLYGQDYFAIRERLQQNGCLFKDEKVGTRPGLDFLLPISLFSFLQTSIL